MCRITELRKLYSGHVLRSYESFKEIIAMPYSKTRCDCCGFDFRGAKMVQFKTKNKIIGQECLSCYVKDESKEFDLIA